MLLEEAKALALELMKQHKLEHWHFEFDGAKRRFGICRYNTKTIGLSKHLVLLNSKESVTDTILHEIAHALVGLGQGHNWVWRQKALEIGCNGKRCHSDEDTQSVERSFIAICPKCAEKYGRFKVPKKKSSCGKCSGGKFNEAYLLEFKRAKVFAPNAQSLSTRKV